MKKVISVIIILVIFGCITAIGFIITRQAFRSGVSNAQLIANIIGDGPSSTSTVTFIHLNNAMTDNVAEPKPTVTFTGTYLEEITPDSSTPATTSQVLLATKSGGQ